MSIKSPYLLILILLVALFGLSKLSTESARGSMAALFSPLWDKLSSFRRGESDGKVLTANEEMARLELANRLLQNELEELREELQRERFLGSYDVETDELTGHRHELQQLMQMQMEAVPARVIFRSRLSWHNSFWINVGERDNKLLGRVAIAKDSPVVIGTSVVGVIDTVKEKQSRVRLITDAELTPSVRCVRGSMQNRLLVEQINALLETMGQRPELFSNQHDRELIEKMVSLKEKLNKDTGSWFLAKGELHGSGKPLWRKQSQQLIGVGFNYDFPDQEGPARELRSGKPIGSSEFPAMAILQVNDLLVTSGMDGVFPPGLQVAVVTDISPLREGDYYYELEAKPTAGNLDELSLVFVMPPVDRS
jgi:rod shape-determining protein MreC